MSFWRRLGLRAWAGSTVTYTVEFAAFVIGLEAVITTVEIPTASGVNAAVQVPAGPVTDELEDTEPPTAVQERVAPTTGFPCDRRVNTMEVVCPNCTVSGLATNVSVTGRGAALNWAVVEASPLEMAAKVPLVAWESVTLV
jgi:hypothetical protein